VLGTRTLVAQLCAAEAAYLSNQGNDPELP
jgi:hypothetical protein